jgi:hypothetical protein
VAVFGPLARNVGPLLAFAVSAIVVIGCQGLNSTPTPTATPQARANLTATPSPTLSATSTSTLSPAPPSGRIGPDAIWVGDVLELHHCPLEGRVQCVTDMMQRSGASAAAIRFFRETGAFLASFREMGLVDMAVLGDPWRANDNSWPALVNGTPDIVVPEAPLTFDVPGAVPPQYEPFARLLSRPWVWQAPEAVFEGVAPAPGGGIVFTFRFPIKDGCHACDTGYWARAAFDFGPDGTFLGPELLPPCWAPVGNPPWVATPVPIVVDACPPPSEP